MRNNYPNLIFLLVMSNYPINIGSTKLFMSSYDSKQQCPICGLQFTTKEENDQHFEL